MLSPINHILPKTRLRELHFCLVSVNATHLAPKAVVLCEITQNSGHWAVQGHPRSPLLMTISLLKIFAMFYEFYGLAC